jgi:hypothetical protein
MGPDSPRFAGYTSCLGHSLEVRLGEDYRLILTLELPLAAATTDSDRPAHTVIGTG